MRCFAEIENLCPHFHLPVQSGSNTVLQRMNRKYTVESYLEKVTALRGYRPDIALATDIIVGFPGETEANFQATMNLLNTVRFHSSFSFKYSDRPHTRSAEFAEKIPEEVKSRRLAVFQNRQDEICLVRNREYIGKKLEVMVEVVNGNDLKGRAATNHIVHCTGSSKMHQPGDLATVHINQAGKHSLKGELQP
jgi:tRNA-2-methylthio-N6-dimethylallyladenosine synthase